MRIFGVMFYGLILEINVLIYSQPAQITVLHHPTTACSVLDLLTPTVAIWVQL